MQQEDNVIRLNAKDVLKLSKTDFIVKYGDGTQHRQFRHVPQRDGQAGSPVRGDVRAVRSDQQIRADGKL